MSRVVDTSKCEHGFSDAYKKTFKGKGRDTRERNRSNANFTANYDKIDWSK